jgi:hypothetical protein
MELVRRLRALLERGPRRRAGAGFGLALGILLVGTGVGLQPAATAVSPGLPPAGADVTAAGAGTVVPGRAAVETVLSAPAPAEAGPMPKDAPAAVLVSDMKHVWQSLNNCGPAAVVMALSAMGVDVSQETARLALRGTDERRGMGPQGVGPWVKENFDLRSTWRSGGTNDLMKRLIANGFVPMVTQWMQDPTASRIAHWRTVRGYDDKLGVFYVNDSMLGNMVPLSYDWFGRNWQSFAYRYMVIYQPQDEALLKTVMGNDWSELHVRRSMYERAKLEALAQNTSLAWLAYGEAAYANGVFDEAVTAFERGFSTGSAAGVFGLRNSYPQALRALGRRSEADIVAQKISGVSTVPSTVAPAPDSYAMYLMIRRSTPFELLPAE